MGGSEVERGGEYGVDCRQLPTKRGLLGWDRRRGGGKKGDTAENVPALTEAVAKIKAQG